MIDKISADSARHDTLNRNSNHQNGVDSLMQYLHSKKKKSSIRRLEEALKSMRRLKEQNLEEKMGVISKMDFENSRASYPNVFHLYLTQ